MRMIEEDEVGLKESQKTLDTSKRLHQNESRRQRKDFIPNFAIMGNGQGHHSLEGPWRG